MDANGVYLKMCCVTDRSQITKNVKGKLHGSINILSNDNEKLILHLLVSLGLFNLRPFLGRIYNK